MKPLDESVKSRLALLSPSVQKGDIFIFSLCLSPYFPYVLKRNCDSVSPFWLIDDKIFRKSVKKFFKEKGLATKVLENNCVFPQSERSDDVRNLLVEEAKQASVQFLYDRHVEQIEKQLTLFNIKPKMKNNF
jgi:hypothetical protein